MKVYICGPITGVENYAETFEQAEQKLLAEGFEVVNPCKLQHNHNKSWRSYMKECIRSLVDCEYIYLLPGWQISEGARLEFDIAVKLGIKLY